MNQIGAPPLPSQPSRLQRLLNSLEGARQQEALERTILEYVRPRMRRWGPVPKIGGLSRPNL